MAFWNRRKPQADWEIRLEKLERKVRDIEVDWDDSYDKFRRLYARLAKRAKEQAPDAPGDSNGGDPGVGAPQTGNPLAARLLNPYGGTPR